MFAAFVGQEQAKLALLLNAIDSQCGGVLLLGEKGIGKSTLARRFKNLLPGAAPFVELPLNATEDGVLGGIDIEATLRSGRRTYQSGVLSRANGGFLYIDDVNLLSREILALVIEAQGRGENLVQKEGLHLSHAAQFQLIASMMVAENPLSPHILDRFGMAVILERIENIELRKQVARQAIAPFSSARAMTREEDEALRRQIEAARQMLGQMRIDANVSEYIGKKCLENGVAGHRGDLYLFYAARAYAALHEKREVDPEDVDVVWPLVLLHRRRMMPPEEEQETPRQRQNEYKQPDSKQPPPDAGDAATSSPEGNAEAGLDSSAKRRESSPLEEVFDIGGSFKVRRFHFRRDRMKRGSSGRKIKSLSRDKRGRYIRSRQQGDKKDIALDATIRAAAPLQRLRGSSGRLLIEPEDLRFKQREKKIGHLVVFVVDGSGSMGAQRRMIETKGAIQSLLLDSYQKRDKVALIVFRRDHAELVLPPTSSIALAKRCLRQIPTGGKTPLSAGLWAAHELVRRLALREPEMRFLVALITDGKANHAMTEASPRDEVSRIASLLQQLPGTEFMVVDTENKSALIKTDQARQIAAKLGASYFPLAALQADTLASFIRAKQEA